MATIELEEAQTHLKIWLAAELELATSQSYKIGTRMLTRANLTEVREQIKFWEHKIQQLQRKGRSRVYRCVPRDL